MVAVRVMVVVFRVFGHDRLLLTRHHIGLPVTGGSRAC
ncbi:hypothetical protein Salmuc_02501 [Salipiger mucosus DSM 16094]|uniref:Uncharacterized protein n=1 Tax=Salipiger mucosus DSM 16094 TaxID=1123237 RepID=S9QR72_9RHOB|nr:hypothetical protein Salmuc_02501 [Salipiger mucosus DSM 16094]